MSADFPWDVLGLDSPGSEAEIRRAYARKLKATRPDEDPEGFQALVQAREFALGIASGAIVLHRIDATEIDAIREPPAMEAPAVATLPEQNEQPEKADFFVAEPSFIFRATEASQPDEKPSDEDLAREKLRRYPAIWDIETWQEIVDIVSNLPFISRQRIEQKLLQAIAQLDWGHICRNKPFSAILLSFSEEFGWEHDSVKLVSLFGNPAQSSAFHDLLCYVRDIAEGRREAGDGEAPFTIASPAWQPDDKQRESAPPHEESSESGKVPWGGILMIVIILVNLVRCASMNTTSSYKYDYKPPAAQTIIERQKKEVEFLREPVYRRPPAPARPQ